MARKSRKPNNQVTLFHLKPVRVQAAAYVRLSVEDRTKKGNSIETQKQIISSYIDKHPDIELCDTYIDSNISGTTFERPNFQRLLHDAEAGIISCVIVKDLSRLGRNMIDTGYYIEQVFPRLRPRLISIGDNYDSSDVQGEERIPFIHLVNEWYAFDISRKRKAQARQAMKDGVYVGGHPPYGYVRSSDNRRKLIVDTSAAETVKQIYAWTVDGTSAYEIARKLNTAKIPSPIAHKSKNQTVGRWYARTVEGILENETYLGNLIQGKTKTVHFQLKPTTHDEWVYAFDTHEAIISLKMFQAVLSLRMKRNENSKGKTVVPYTLNIYKGKIYCAHCGGHMERRKNHGNYVFHCIANRTVPDSCVGHRIREDAVADALSEQLLQLKDELLKQQDVPSKEAEILPELRFIAVELAQLENFPRTLFEDMTNGILDEAEYLELKSIHRGKMDELIQRAAALQQVLDDEKRASKRRWESLQILDALADTRILTAEHIDRFVDRLIVFKDGRVHVEVVM